MKKIMLYPNCSEIIWKLGSNTVHSTWTDSFPNGALMEMVDILKIIPIMEREDVEVEFVENSGGGGNWDYVENVFGAAKEIYNKKLSPTIIDEIDKKIWNDEDYKTMIRGYTVVKKHPRITKRKKTSVKRHIRRIRK